MRPPYVPRRLPIPKGQHCSPGVRNPPCPGSGVFIKTCPCPVPMIRATSDSFFAGQKPPCPGSALWTSTVLSCPGTAFKAATEPDTVPPPFPVVDIAVKAGCVPTTAVPKSRTPAIVNSAMPTPFLSGNICLPPFSPSRTAPVIRGRGSSTHVIRLVFSCLPATTRLFNPSSPSPFSSGRTPRSRSPRKHSAA